MKYRWGPIYGLCLFCFIASVLDGYQLVSPSYNLAALPPNTVSVTTSDQPAFRVKLEALAGSSSAFTALGNVAPLCVIISNVSEKPILAVTIRYDVKHVSGRQMRWDFQREGLTGRAGTFAPNSSYLVTPSTRLTNLIYRHADKSLIESEVADLSVTTLSPITSVVISVDSILYSDGLLVGPDRANAYSQFNELLRAQRDFIHEVQSKDAAPDADLETLLKSKSANAASSRDSIDFYGRRQYLLAQTLLAALHRGGRRAVGDELKALSANHIVIKRGE